MLNSISSLQRTLEGIAGVEGGINLTGVGAMGEESSGLGEANISVAEGIGNWPLGLGRAVGRATNTCASGGTRDGSLGLGMAMGVANTSTSTGTGEGSVGFSRGLGGGTNTYTSTATGNGSGRFGRAMGGANISISMGMGDDSLGFGRAVVGATNTSISGTGNGSLGLGRAMGGANISVGGMGDWSLGLSRAMGEVTNTSTTDGLLAGLNVPEVEEGFGGPMGGNSVSGSGGNDGGIGAGVGVGGLGGVLGYVREGSTSAGSREDVMRTRSVDDLHALAKSQQHFAVLLVRKLFSREQLLGRSAMGGKMGKLPLDRAILGNVKAIYFQYYPSQHKDEDWKRCITAINTYLRSKACKKTCNRLFY